MKFKCISYLLAGWLLFFPGKWGGGGGEQTSKNEELSEIQAFKSLAWFNWFKKKETCCAEIQEI